MVQLRPAIDTENDHRASRFLAECNNADTSPVGPLGAFENERRDGTRKQVVLPDPLTPTVIPKSHVLFISHNTSQCTLKIALKMTCTNGSLPRPR